MIFTTDLTMLTERAIVVATRAFQTRRDKDGTPTINHSLRVGMAGVNENQRVMGYLHDVIEDTNVKEEDLLEWGFPDFIVNGLKLLTHFGTMTTYEGYIRNIALNGNKDVLAVKLNDLVDNIRRDDPIKNTVRFVKHLTAYNKLLKAYEDTYGSFPGEIKKGDIQGQC